MAEHFLFLYNKCMKSEAAARPPDRLIKKKGDPRGEK